MTVTPKVEIDLNTYGLFDEDGVPTDAYPLDQAVADGHLVPPLAVSVPLKFQRDGKAVKAINHLGDEVLRNGLPAPGGLVLSA